MSDVPPDLRRQLLENPLSWESDRERVLAGDLEFGARRYAQTAQARTRELWGVWWEIQQARKLTFSAATSELTTAQKDLFFHWCFPRPELAAPACDAHSILLRDPGADRLRSSAVLYLWTLHRLGRHEDVLREVDLLLTSLDDRPEEETVAAHAEQALGKREEARARIERVRDRHHDDGRLWAHAAILHHRQSRRREARIALGECAKLGVHDDDLLASALEQLRISRAEWGRLRTPWEFSRDPDDEPRSWSQDPGATLEPCEGPSPHAFGGVDFRMPACRGCGRPIRQWFVLDLRRIDPLRSRLTDWALFPLLGCTDCGMWLGRHDYAMDPHSNAVRLTCVGTSARFGTPYAKLSELPRRPARLVWRARPSFRPGEWPDGYLNWDEPQVAGRPAWVQDPLHVFCRDCRQEMVFVAAMSTVRKFEVAVPINNESGFQYHFACPGCRTISVIAQNT